MTSTAALMLWDARRYLDAGRKRLEELDAAIAKEDEAEAAQRNAANAERCRRYRERHPEYFRAWRKRNKVRTLRVRGAA